jgi:Tol biopolymer transport system component
VSAQGLVEARQAGTVAIVAASEGKEGRATITVSPAPVASVQLDASEVTLAELQTRQLAAVVRDARGQELAGRAIAWTSDNEAVATVSATGLVTARAAGTAVVVATSEGQWASAMVAVSPTAVAAMQLDVAELTLAEGTGRRLLVTLTDAQGNVLAPRAVQWASNDPAVATVAGDGTVTALRWGVATITARVGERTATATISVSSDVGFDLLYDSPTGFGNEPELYRLDIRVPGTPAVRVFQFAGARDVVASPDGMRIVFTCREMFGPAICVANRDGSNLVRLTSGPTHEDQPAWSPDGTRIAFRRWAQGGPPGPFNPGDIWVMNADGSGQVNLTGEADDAGAMESPTWSPRQPDGSYRIAYSRQTTQGEHVVGRIHSMRADGSDKRGVTTGGDYLETEPAWSPDGQTIVFVRTGGTAFGDLWLVNAAGGSERALLAVTLTSAQRAPAWSPDGRLIAFTSNHEFEADGSYRYQIYTVRTDGTLLVRRSFRGADKENPSWSPRF